MGLNASKVAGSAPRTPPLETGMYKGRLVQLLDLGLQPRKFKGEDKSPAQEVSLTYEISDEFLLDEDGEPQPDKPRWVSETFYLFNLDVDKAKSTIRYKSLDPALKYGGDFSLLMGTAVNIHVVSEPNKKGMIYMQVSGLAPLREKERVGMPNLVNAPRVFDMDDPDMEVYEQIPQWLKNRMISNLEFGGSKLAEMLENLKLPQTGSTLPATDIETVGPGSDSDDNPY